MRDIGPPASIGSRRNDGEQLGLVARQARPGEVAPQAEYPQRNQARDQQRERQQVLEAREGHANRRKPPFACGRSGAACPAAEHDNCRTRCDLPPSCRPPGQASEGRLLPASTTFFAATKGNAWIPAWRGCSTEASIIRAAGCQCCAAATKKKVFNANNANGPAAKRTPSESGDIRARSAEGIHKTKRKPRFNSESPTGTDLSAPFALKTFFFPSLRNCSPTPRAMPDGRVMHRKDPVGGSQTHPRPQDLPELHGAEGIAEQLRIFAWAVRRCGRCRPQTRTPPPVQGWRTMT